MSTQRSESVERVSQATPTDGRTDGLTQNLQDQGDNLTFLNAHENSGEIRNEVDQIAELLATVTQQIRTASQRMPGVRTGPRRPLDPQVRAMVLLRDGYACRWCKRHIRDGAAFEVDHITPWSAGGTNATDNLRTLCVQCNQERSNYRTDVDMAQALLIVGHCPWCRGRHLIHDAWATPVYVYDEEAVEVSPADREVAVWCIGCRAPSATSRAHADDVRRRQSERVAPADYEPRDRDQWLGAGE